MAEAHDEPIVLLHPNGVADVAAEGVFIVHLHLAGIGLRVVLLFVPCRSVVEVDEECCICRVVEGETVYTGMGGGGDFGLYARTVEEDAVVSGPGTFAALAEGGAVVGGVVAGYALEGGGHDEHITEVHTACTIKMSLGESPNGTVCTHIFRTVVPAYAAGDGRGLD